MEGKNILETIEDLFKASKKIRSKSAIEICGKVMSDIEENQFQFMDLSDSIIVKVLDPRFLESPFISAKRYIKISPEIETVKDKKYLTLCEESQVIPTQKLKLLADLDWSRLDCSNEDKTEIEKINKLFVISVLNRFAATYNTFS